jgi:hypothetical protein
MVSWNFNGLGENPKVGWDASLRSRNELIKPDNAIVIEASQNFRFFGQK